MIELKLTRRQWFLAIEALDETGFEQAHVMPTRGNGKTRKNGRRMLRLASSLRNKLKGKI